MREYVEVWGKERYGAHLLGGFVEMFGARCVEGHVIVDSAAHSIDPSEELGGADVAPAGAVGTVEVDV